MKNKARKRSAAVRETSRSGERSRIHFGGAPQAPWGYKRAGGSGGCDYSTPQLDYGESFTSPFKQPFTPFTVAQSLKWPGFCAVRVLLNGTPV